MNPSVGVLFDGNLRKRWLRDGLNRGNKKCSEQLNVLVISSLIWRRRIESRRRDGSTSDRRWQVNPQPCLYLETTLRSTSTTSASHWVSIVGTSGHLSAGLCVLYFPRLTLRYSKDGGGDRDGVSINQTGGQRWSSNSCVIDLKPVGWRQPVHLWERMW